MILRTALALPAVAGLLMASTMATAVPTEGVGGDGASGVAMTGTWSSMTRAQSDPTMSNFDANVILLGDSIGVATFPSLSSTLTAKGYAPRYDANSSIPTLPSVERFAQYMEARLAAGKGRPRTVIMALGTNDTVTGTWQGPTKVKPQVERVRRLMGAGRLLYVNVWANSTSAASRAAGVNLTNSRTINASVLTAKGPNGRPAITRVIDWYGFLAASPYRQRTYLRDGVHTTALGTAARNALIAAYLPAVAS